MEAFARPEGAHVAPAKEASGSGTRRGFRVGTGTAAGTPTRPPAARRDGRRRAGQAWATRRPGIDGLAGEIGALAALLATFQALGLGHFADRVLELLLGLAELFAQLVGRTGQILAAGAGRAGIGRIGEMRHVRDAGLVLFGRDFPVEIAGHSEELGDHHLDLRHPAALLVDLKAF